MGVGGKIEPCSQDSGPILRVTRTPCRGSPAEPRRVAAGAEPPRCHSEAETIPKRRDARRPGQSASASASPSRWRSGRRPPPRAATPWRPAQPVTPDGDPRPAWNPAAFRPQDLRLALGPSSRTQNPVRPGTPARPGPEARRLTSGRRLGSARSLPEAPWPSQAERSSRQSRGHRNNGAPGRGRLAAAAARHPLWLGIRLPLRAEQRPAESAAGLGDGAGALTPPAQLRPAPGGARRSGPAPRPMGRAPRGGGGAWRNKGRWGGAAPGRGRGVPPGAERRGAGSAAQPGPTREGRAQ
ncbi:uncharacterized protein LOC102159659 [Sus scrofa]|uniref:uncharacterized protein LOC102159659 n=1 Tax=Sus scrofa TaxID=9823 RepID=UPI000A2B7FF9|nr:uncharacterized protein LOC102159659 [Sus scrofa]